MQHPVAGGPAANLCLASLSFRPCRAQWCHQKHDYHTGRHRKSGVCIQGMLVSAFHVFPAYPRHRRPPSGMRYGLLKAEVRSQPATELLAPSARSVTCLRMQAHTTDTAVATATPSVMTPLSHHSGVPHRTHTPSYRPSDRRTATAAGPITPAVVLGSRRRPACSMPLRADRRRTCAAPPCLFAPAELSGAIRNTITITEGTEKAGFVSKVC